MNLSKLPALHRPFAEAIAEFYRGEWAFTGTRAGMTAPQMHLVRRIFRAGEPLVLLHGGAHGADEEAHAIWRELKLPLCQVWPADAIRGSRFEGQVSVRVHSPVSALLRNVEMVKRTTFLVAAPHTQREELRSGTWHTIRQALKMKHPTLIVWPNGYLTLYFQDSLKRLIVED